MHLLEFINWDPEPSIFGLPFRWYGLLFASSFFFGYILMNRIFKKERVPEKWLDSVTIYMAISTVVGARLGHCFFYDPEYYLAHPLEIIQVWKGGLASHGAAIGIITGLILWSRKISKRSVLWILDRIVIMVALSGLFIRTGNLVNSEILGKPTTSELGFVFPRSDQSDYLRAKWEKENVEISYSPMASYDARLFEFFRSTDNETFTQIGNEPKRVEAGKVRKEPAVKLVDSSPGTKAELHYFSAEVGGKPALEISNGDSINPRIASFKDPFSPKINAFSGKWEGEQVHIRLDMRGIIKNNSARGTLLLRKAEGDNWDLIHRGVLSSTSNKMILDTFDLPTGIQNPVYKLVVKEDESLLVARHPAQLYEALSYTLIFLFLWWYYYKLDGKVPYGRLFGLFLVLVFGARFLIEYAKEEQVDFLGTIPINMGQILSIPFVLAGIVFIFLSIKRPKIQGDSEVAN